MSLDGPSTKAIVHQPTEVSTWPKPAHWIVLYEYTLPRPTNLPSTQNPTRLHTAYVISRRQPGREVALDVAERLRPDGLEVIGTRVLAITRVDNPEEWAEKWIDLNERQGDGDDDK